MFHKNQAKFIFHFFLLLFISGCIQTTQTFTSINVDMSASPNFLVPGGETIVSVNVDNIDDKTYENINLDIFDTGDLIEINSCRKTIPELKPEGIATMQCFLKAPDNIKKENEEINVKATFSSSLPLAKTVTVLTQSEYNLLKKTGKLNTEGNTFSAKDRNIEIVLEFSNAVPLIKSKDEQFATIKIRNIGNGFVGPLSSSDITIQSEFLRCNVPELIYPLEKEFPTISCRIDFPDNINNLRDDLIVININYDYDVRKSLKIPIR